MATMSCSVQPYKGAYHVSGKLDQDALNLVMLVGKQLRHGQEKMARTEGVGVYGVVVKVIGGGLHMGTSGEGSIISHPCIMATGL